VLSPSASRDSPVVLRIEHGLYLLRSFEGFALFDGVVRFAFFGEAKGTQLFSDKQGPKKSCVPFSSPFSSLLGLDRCRRHRVQAVTRSNH
jgi:hypothetical protein